MYHTQLGELIDLARAFPATPIVLDHVGGAIGLGPYAARRDEVFAEWSGRIRSLAACPNVHIKVGGLGMRMFGFTHHLGELPPSSEELAAAWRPYVETCIAAFGAERAMFESNFPVEQGRCSYHVLWNAFKRIAAGCSAAEKAALFAGTATESTGWNDVYVRHLQTQLWSIPAHHARKRHKLPYLARQTILPPMRCLRRCHALVSASLEHRAHAEEFAL